ncbi:MAG: glycosyltransferase family A protein [Bacteroidia bacterium]|nr:glycosyltransferase family A protein [Bacteroidia bacterium]
MSKVSVIIPNYNNSNWLPNVIQSCLDQGEEYLKEIIVVDDFSTDASWNILVEFWEKHPNLIKICQNTIKGGNNARNCGFELSTGEYIQWLDSDDLLLPDKFKQQITFLENNPEYDIVYSDMQLDCYSENNLTGSKICKREFYKDYLLELIKDNWTGSNNYLMRRKIANSLHLLGAWNPSTKVGQDREYFLNAAFLGARFGYTPGIYCIYTSWSNKSVSNIDFKKRLQITLSKNFEYYLTIKDSDRLSFWMKLNYISVINAHAINSYFYDKELKINWLINPILINFKIIHWKKILVFPILYYYSLINYLNPDMDNKK